MNRRMCVCAGRKCFHTIEITYINVILMVSWWRCESGLSRVELSKRVFSGTQRPSDPSIRLVNVNIVHTANIVMKIPLNRILWHDVWRRLMARLFRALPGYRMHFLIEQIRWIKRGFIVTSVNPSWKSDMKLWRHLCWPIVSEFTCKFYFQWTFFEEILFPSGSQKRIPFFQYNSFWIRNSLDFWINFMEFLKLTMAIGVRTCGIELLTSY